MVDTMGVKGEAKPGKGTKSKEPALEDTDTTVKSVPQDVFVRPPIDIVQDIKDGVSYILFNPEAILIVGPLLLFLESAVMKIITKRVAYTEIDYHAYMEQIEMIKYQGNYHYSEIRGGTGPLVYPAGHVFIYRIMYWISHGMDNIYYGQVVFRYLYLTTLMMQLFCYYELEMAPWCAVLFSLSKRLHSIYVLRLFNDCFTTFFVVMTIMIFLLGNKFGKRGISSVFGSITYSIAVCIKMNALLYFPGILITVYLFNNGNLMKSIACLLIMILWQFIIALPFLSRYPMEYLEGAFNFQRQFMYEWSINWQFIDESIFQASVFQRILLLGSLVLMTIVILLIYPNILSDIFDSIRHPLKERKSTEKKDIKTLVSKILIITNFVGILFSRSLHYQFLCWYQWTLPILLNWSGLPLYIGPVWYVLHEWCWNSYPPNARASLLLLICNSSLLVCILTHETINYHRKCQSLKDTKEMKSQ